MYIAILCSVLATGGLCKGADLRDTVGKPAGGVRKMRRHLAPWQKKYIDDILFRNGPRGETLGAWHGTVANTLSIENQRLTSYVGNRLRRARLLHDAKRAQDGS